MRDEQDGVVVDFQRIADTADGDVEFERELFEIYLCDGDERLARLRDCWQRGEVEAVSREAHAIKGASANVGAETVREIAFTLEKCTSGRDPADPGDTIEALCAAFAKTRTLIEKHCS